jgi:parallel beta-helix repeat protein
VNSFRTERFLALPFIILLLLSSLPVANSEPKIVSTQSFTTIQQAINNANAGDTIIVPAGVYYEHVTVNKTVTLVGENNKTTIIDGGNTSTVVEVTANGVSIVGFTIRNSGWGWTRNGVLVHYADNCEIRGNYFVHNGHNIRLNYSRASWVVGNVIDGDGYGIRLLHATDCMAVGNSVSNVIGAVHLEFATNCIVKQNNFTRNSQGIRMYSPCTYNTITANTAANNTYDGMIDDSMNGNGTFNQNEIFHNNFVNNTYPFINRGTGNIWHNDYPSGGNYWSRYNGTDQYSGVDQDQTGSDGIGDTPYTFAGNNVDKYPLMQRWTEFPVSNLDTSRRYVSIQDAIDASETLSGHALRVETGFYLQNIVVGKSLKIVGANRFTTTICGGFTGTVVTVNVNNVSISGFTIHQSGLSYPPYGMDCGVLLNHTSGCNISRNIITSNRAGLYLYFSEANIIKENIVSSNRDGLWLWYSGGNVLSGNEIAGNRYNFGVFGGDFADFDNLMDETNAVDNKPVRYIVNAQSEVIDEQIDAGVLYFINCVNVTVRNLNLTKNGHCVFFYNVSNSRIENVTATQSNYGLYLQESNNNTITGNRCMNDWVGVTLQDSGNNVVEGNIAKDCEKGISLYGADNNSLKRNMLQNNLYGIRLSSSNVNAIFHNNLVENTQQVDVISSYQNAWDNGCEGNYWSNYNGSDLDNDGVGDSYLPWEGLDSYPLVASYIVGDVNHDGRINVLDIIKIGVAYMATPTDIRWNPHADIAEPYDIVDMGDLLLAAQALVNNGE